MSYSLVLVGYLSGSILYAYLLPKYICHIDIMKDSDDHNPGTFNAFALAGTQVGILVIALEHFERISSDLAGFTYSGYKKMDVCICSLCTCCRACVSPVLSETWRKSHRSFFWSIIGTAAAIPPGAASHLRFICYFPFLIVVKPHLYRSILTFTLFSLTGLFYFHDAVISMGTIFHFLRGHHPTSGTSSERAFQHSTFLQRS